MMRRRKFSDEQISEIIRESENTGVEVPELYPQHNISEPTFYRWKKKCTGMDAAQIAEMKQLRLENARMRKLIVNRDPNLDVTRQLLKKSF
jgi:putative transposase